MSDARWSEAIGRMLVRVQDTAARVTDGFPHWADPDTGEWVTTPAADWTGGYWVGMLWLAHRATGDARYRDWTRPLLERLRPRADADTGFRSFVFQYAGMVGALVAGDPTARELALRCARSYERLYAPALRLVPIGSQGEEGSHVGPGEASIDTLQVAPFLFWAAREGAGDTLRDIARSHAERVIALHLREDGSFIQSSSLDPATGELVKHYTHKGYSDTSTWGRAQAWGTLFSAASHLAEPARRDWLQASMRGADWWMAHVPADRVAFWDFDDPAIPNTERDTAATAIATAAFLRLGAIAPEGARARYRAFAEAAAETLITRYLTPTGPGDRRVPGILTEACFNKRPDARPQDAANRCEFIVGSYYLLESLLVLAGTLDPTAI